MLQPTLAHKLVPRRISAHRRPRLLRPARGRAKISYIAKPWYNRFAACPWHFHWDRRGTHESTYKKRAGRIRLVVDDSPLCSPRKNMPGSELSIRQMTAGDLPVVDALRRAENWNQTAKDLERFLRYEPDGCFLACWDGVAVGTVTTTAYGTDLGWIGMMLVHADYRRRGIASALIQTSLEYLRAKTWPRSSSTPRPPVNRFMPGWVFKPSGSLSDGNAPVRVPLSSRSHHKTTSRCPRMIPKSSAQTVPFGWNGLPRIPASSSKATLSACCVPVPGRPILAPSSRMNPKPRRRLSKNFSAPSKAIFFGMCPHRIPTPSGLPRNAAFVRFANCFGCGPDNETPAMSPANTPSPTPRRDERHLTTKHTKDTKKDKRDVPGFKERSELEEHSSPLIKFN